MSASESPQTPKSSDSHDEDTANETPHPPSAPNLFNSNDVAAILREQGWATSELSTAQLAWCERAATFLGPHAADRESLADLLSLSFSLRRAPNPATGRKPLRPGPLRRPRYHPPRRLPAPRRPAAQLRTPERNRQRNQIHQRPAQPRPFPSPAPSISRPRRRRPTRPRRSAPRRSRRRPIHHPRKIRPHPHPRILRRPRLTHFL